MAFDLKTAVQDIQNTAFLHSETPIQAIAALLTAAVNVNNTTIMKKKFLVTLDLDVFEVEINKRV